MAQDFSNRSNKYTDFILCDSNLPNYNKYNSLALNAQNITKNEAYPVTNNNNSQTRQSNSNILQIHDSDSTTIMQLKQWYMSRINHLISNWQICVTNLTSFNGKEVINETIFAEKEATIAGWYEQNILIQNEYDKSTNEILRLEKVIKVYEIDLNKYEGDIAEMNNINTEWNKEIFEWKYTIQNIKQGRLCNNESSSAEEIEANNKRIGDWERVWLQTQINFEEEKNRYCHNWLYKEAVISKLQNEISRFKADFASVKEEVVKSFNTIINVNKKISSDIAIGIKTFIEETRKKFRNKASKSLLQRQLIEQFHITDKYREKNKTPFKNQEMGYEPIKDIKNDKNNSEYEISYSNEPISKLEAIKIKDMWTPKHLYGEKQISVFKLKVNHEILGFINKIKDKYKRNIIALKNQILELHKISSIKERGEHNNNNQNIRYISQWQKINQDIKKKNLEWEECIIEKDKKIKTLKTALQKPNQMINNSWKNLKVAQKIDEDISLFLQQMQTSTPWPTNK